MINASFSESIPSLSNIVPLESESVTTFPPKSLTFSVAYCATFPEPETATDLPLKESPLVFNISSAKYTHPYPVASGLIKLPPQLRPFPVNTPVNSLRIRLY